MRGEKKQKSPPDTLASTSDDESSIDDKSMEDVDEGAWILWNSSYI